VGDTGQAAGQQVEFAFRLRQSGAALSYANKAAFESAGWLLNYRAAQVVQTPEFTMGPHSDASLAALGWHLFVLTIVNGQGPVIPDFPASGSGWSALPVAYHVGAESTDIDDAYNAVLQSVGVASAVSNAVSISAEVNEGDGLQKQFTGLETALTEWGFVNTNLTDGTLQLVGSVRSNANRVGEPDAYIGVSVVTADVASNPVFRYGWLTFPSAMAFPSANPADDAAVADALFNVDVAYSGTLLFAITGGNQAGKTFTVAGDRRSYFPKGSTKTIASSTGNNGAYTVVSSTYNGTSTTVTVTEAVPSATFDGNFTETVKQTLGYGTITVKSQVDRQ